MSYSFSRSEFGGNLLAKEINMNTSINSRLAGGILFFLVTGVLAGLSGGLLVRPMRDVRDSGRTAFQRTLDFADSASPSFTVPSGNRLALMYVAVTMGVGTGQQPLVSIKTTVGGNSALYPLILTRQVTNVNGSDVYVGSQSVSGIFADAGTEVVVNGSTTMSKSFNGRIALSGFFIE